MNPIGVIGHAGREDGVEWPAVEKVKSGMIVRKMGIIWNLKCDLKLVKLWAVTEIPNKLI